MIKLLEVEPVWRMNGEDYTAHLVTTDGFACGAKCDHQTQHRANSSIERCAECQSMATAISVDEATAEGEWWYEADDQEDEAK